MRNKSIIKRIYRRLAIWVAQAYHSLSRGSAGHSGDATDEPTGRRVLSTYHGVERSEASNTLLNKWQERWNNASTGRWRYRLLPSVRVRLGRGWGEIDFWTVRGFRVMDRSMNTCVRGRRTTPYCQYCGQVNNGEHMLLECPRWAPMQQFREECSSEDIMKYYVHLWE